MPRISAAALGVVPVAELEFPPPSHFSEVEKVVFRDVVGSADPGHFRHEDRELLALYCARVVAARTLMKRRRRAVEQERDLRAATALIISLSEIAAGTEIESAGQQEGGLGGHAQTRTAAVGPTRGSAGSAGEATGNGRAERKPALGRLNSPARAWRSAASGVKSKGWVPVASIGKSGGRHPPLASANKQKDRPRILGRRSCRRDCGRPDHFPLASVSVLGSVSV